MDGSIGTNKLPYSLNKLASGLLVPPFTTQELIDELRKMSLRKDDVFVVTFPKSGTTWMQQVVKLIHRNGEDNNEVIVKAAPWLERVGSSGIKDLSSPRIFKSHMVYQQIVGGSPASSPAKYIYIARNPKDVVVSMYHHTLAWKEYEFNGTFDEFFDYFANGKVQWGSWYYHVSSWWSQKDFSNILFLKYEDMKEDLHSTVVKVAQFLGYSLSAQVVDRICEQTTFENMKSNPVANYSWDDRREGAQPFLRKGVIGDWKNYLSDAQSARLEEGCRQLAQKGLVFDFE